MPHRCRYCSKICRTARGLSQHIERTKDCREQHLCELTARRLAQDDSNQEASGARERSLGATPPRRSKRLKGIEESGHETESPHSLIARLSNADEDASFPDLDEDDGNTMRKDDYSDFDESKESNDGSYDFTANEDVDEASEDSDKPPPNTEMLEQFRAYCVGHVHKYVRLTSQTVSSIKLAYGCPQEEEGPIECISGNNGMAFKRDGLSRSRPSDPQGHRQVLFKKHTDETVHCALQYGGNVSKRKEG